MPSLLLRGPRAFPPPRLEKLRILLSPEPAELAAYHVHLVDLERELGGTEAEKLQQLLHYGTIEDNLELPAEHSALLSCLSLPAGDADAPKSGLETCADTKVYVTIPRDGTISPWSSKATDIARICGLDAIHRVERGIVFVLKYADKAPEFGSWVEGLFDRMIERVVSVEEWRAHEGGWADFVFRKGIIGWSATDHFRC